MRDDIRAAWRALRADSLVTFLSVVLIALTAGAVTAVFALVQGVILRPLAVAEQHRVAVLWQTSPSQNYPVMEVAWGEAAAWKRGASGFEDIAVFGSVNWTTTIVDGGEKQGVPFASVSATFFDVLGTPPVIGRTFRAEDEEGFETRTVILSHGLWVRRFGADPAALGRMLYLQGGPDGPPRPHEIVGVMPAEFDFPAGAALWLPAAPGMRAFGQAEHEDPEVGLAGYRVFYAVGRLRRGVSPDAAERELTALIGRLQQPSASMPPSAVVTPIRDHVLGPAAPVLWTLLGGAALMLLIACANVAALQVFRAARQDRALAVRLALGASRLRLVRQAVVESGLVAVVAAAGAAVMAWASMRALTALAPMDVPRLASASVADARVLGFAVLVGVATVALCGLWPAIFSGRVDAAAVLSHGVRAASAPRERRLQSAVVAVQVGVAVVLLSGTALFVRSVQALNATPLGFEPAGLLTMNVTPPTSDVDRWNAFYDELLGRVRALPTVAAAGAVYLRPLSGPIGNDTIPVLHGQDPKDFASWSGNPFANLEVVTPGYFQAMGTRLLRGRLFDSRDTLTGPGAVIVSETAARRLWPGRDALGQRLLVYTRRPRTKDERVVDWQSVVGVVEDIRYRGLSDPRLDLYLPAAQSLNTVKHLMVRASGDPLRVAASVRESALALDPGASVDGVAAMSEMVARAAAPWRFAMRVLSVFAALAAALAAVGLGAAASLAVALRRREFAIRAAVGASRRQLGSLVLGEGMRLIGAGLLAGLAASLALGRAIGSLLVSVAPHDALALAAAAAAALCAGLAGLAWPARRAALVDPATALRAE